MASANGDNRIYMLETPAVAALIQPLWVTVALAACGAIASLFAWLKSRQIHQEVTTIKIEINSRMDQLLKATEQAALLAGANGERARHAAELDPQDEQSGH